ncbi:MAG: glycosyltransferase family 9 protein [Desulfobacteraceae bacterium]|nr:MAG: glycosyltransferase family 9 protein [Desulfobacteraceae bacterium]
MDINIQRKIDLYAGTLICRLISLFSGRKEIYSHKPKNILVILLSEMGSLVLARPMFDRLKIKYPDAKIYGLLFEQNRIMLELIDAIPKENILTVSNQSFGKMMFTSIQAFMQMRRKNIDTVIDCELFSRISSIFSFFSGAEIRVGFHRHKQEGLYRGDFINRPVLYNPYHHIFQQFITLAESIESHGTPRVKRNAANEAPEQPRIHFSAFEIEQIRGRFFSDFPHIVQKKIVLMYPSGGLLPIRAWPLKQYCNVAEELIAKGYAVGIIGMPADKELAKTIQAHCNHDDCIDLTGYTETVRELMVIFHFTSLLITNDGGPGHFAAMTPIPSIIFYGPETPVLYGPLTANTCIFYQSLSCSPCLTAYNHRNSPCDGDNRCLIDIRSEDVVKKAVEMLER